MPNSNIEMNFLDKFQWDGEKHLELINYLMGKLWIKFKLVKRLNNESYTGFKWAIFNFHFNG